MHLLFSRNYSLVRELNMQVYVRVRDKMQSKITHSQSPFRKHRPSLGLAQAHQGLTPNGYVSGPEVKHRIQAYKH